MSSSYTMTKKELVDSVIDSLKHVLAGNIKDYLEGSDIDPDFFRNWYNLRRLEKIRNEKDPILELVINFWCETMSESWFQNHPEIDDVLLLVDEDGMTKFKIWMASK